VNYAPVISHHLFVAAVGNETRSQERSARRRHPPAERVAQGAAIPLELMDRFVPLPGSALRALRATSNPART
jgi:hypothetical protein